jgi:AcrR family transcriptional regulator
VRDPSDPGRSGRRPGETLSRQAILQSARDLFAEQGFASTTVRAIARRAGVDPALVHYFFTNKEGVYEAVVQDAVGLMDLLESVIDGGKERLAERLVPTYLELWEGENGDTLAAIYRTAMARGVTDDPLVVSLTPDQLVTQLADAIGSFGARLRATLILSQLHGVVVQRHVLKLDPLASASLSQVTRWVTPAIDALVNP